MVFGDRGAKPHASRGRALCRRAGRRGPCGSAGGGRPSVRVLLTVPNLTEPLRSIALRRPGLTSCLAPSWVVRCTCCTLVREKDVRMAATVAFAEGATKRRARSQARARSHERDHCGCGRSFHAVLPWVIGAYHTRAHRPSAVSVTRPGREGLVRPRDRFSRRRGQPVQAAMISRTRASLGRSRIASFEPMSRISPQSKQAIRSATRRACLIDWVTTTTA